MFSSRIDRARVFEAVGRGEVRQSPPGMNPANQRKTVGFAIDI